MIKTVIFDIGNVLMHFDYLPYIKDLLKDDDVIEEVNSAIWRTGYWNQLDLGMDKDEVFARMFAANPAYSEEIRLTLDHVGKCIRKADYAIDWIKSLKERNYQVLYLSNYSEFIMGAGPEALDFLPYMDGGVFSCYVGVIKPDPDIFRKICDEYELNPSESVFIDDNEANIKAAEEFGLHAILFLNREQAGKDLEDILSREGESEG